MKKLKPVGNPHIGSSVNDFLQEEGILEEARAIAIKEVVSWQIEQARQQLSTGTPSPC
jgi:antitoxin HicB